MEWVKKGLIFNADKNQKKMYSHAQVPSPLHLDKQLYRIYFSSRDDKGRTYPYYLDYDFMQCKVISIQESPLLEHGAIGTFDDSGVMPASVVRHNDLIYMYYIGWNQQVTVSYGLSIGLAISKDEGKTFEKFSNGPLLDRSIDEPFFNSAPYVIKDNDMFKMWYVSCTGWITVDDKVEPLYYVRYAESDDGIKWKKREKPAIPYKAKGESIGRPWVIKQDCIYKMWYSTRGSENYRKKGGQHYMIGYAESEDGIVWSRMDKLAGINLSDSGWDSEMIEYCSVIDLGDRNVMLYNGNSFGFSGFGYAESKK